MNIHNPARYPNETQAEYRARRAQSKAHTAAITFKGVNKGLTNSRQQMRSHGVKGRIRAYKALMAAWASKRITEAVLRDYHGAYTLVGRAPKTGPIEFVQQDNAGRRVWLAGISAQRGY